MYSVAENGNYGETEREIKIVDKKRENEKNMKKLEEFIPLFWFSIGFNLVDKWMFACSWINVHESIKSPTRDRPINCLFIINKFDIARILAMFKRNWQADIHFRQIY